MAYRLVYTDFWTDPKVLEEMTPEDKLYWLYLLTNPNTNMIGIYQITKKQMAYELGYSIESINSLLDRFENYHKLVHYNPTTRELVIKNWGKYNLNKGGKPVLDCIRKDLKLVVDKTLINHMIDGIKSSKIQQLFEESLGYKIDESSTNRDTNGGTTGGQYLIPNTQYLIPNTNTTTITNNNSINISNVQVFKHFEKCGFRLTPLQLEEIAADIEIYSPSWVMDAAMEASNRGKLNYSYVKGILSNWSAKGRETKKEGDKVGTSGTDYGEQLREQGIGL